MSNKHLHIVSFNVPYPANYGGVIDVFYKIVQLHQAGIRIHLHCFIYGREEQPELEKYCEELHYYPRKEGAIYALHFRPYIVVTRSSESLVQRLLLDDYPILIEGLHCCQLLNDNRLSKRFKLFRESNIEHIYYFHLFKSERNWRKKLFFLSESIKLKIFERAVSKAQLMLTVSQSDTLYFKEKYQSSMVHYLPSFHPNNKVESKTGVGNYILYHGNLAVAENHLAAMYILKHIVPKSKQQFIFAGLNPANDLMELIDKSKNASLIANPDDAKMTKLIQEAHVHLLITFQATGLKLKLLNVLYSGRFCLVNDEMLSGTGLDNLCEVANSDSEILQKLEALFIRDFSAEQIQIRNNVLAENYSNQVNVKKLISFCYEN